MNINGSQLAMAVPTANWRSDRKSYPVPVARCTTAYYAKFVLSVQCALRLLRKVDFTENPASIGIATRTNRSGRSRKRPSPKKPSTPLQSEVARPKPG